MKIKNSTDWPVWFLRRMLSWCCKQLDMPAKDIRLAVFRNSRAAWGGSAYYWRGAITVCVGAASYFPSKGYKHGNGHQNTITDRLECLVWVTAHEAAHVAQKHTRSRQSGSGGGSEISTEWHATPVLEQFRAMRDALLSKWNTPPAATLRPPQPNLLDRRAAKAKADLDKWTRKLKLAQTKVRKLKTRVRYYEKKVIPPHSALTD